jgi:hypothetical protein
MQTPPGTVTQLRKVADALESADCIILLVQKGHVAQALKTQRKRRWPEETGMNAPLKVVHLY